MMQMKTLHYSIIILLTAGLLAFTTNSVYAPCLVGVTDCGPPPGVTVSTWTDSQFYEKNDTIDLKGKLYVENYTNPVQVQVINPTNMTVQTLETSVNNNMFFVKINANFNDSGMYQIVTCVKSWCDRSYFKYTAEPYHLSFNGGNYLIWYKSIADLQKIDVDVGAQALRVHISGATAEGLQFVITLPRDLIDFQSARGDQNFTVLVGVQQPDKYMQPADFKEIATSSLSRTLAIDIPYKPISDVQGVWDFKITGSDVLSGPSVFSNPPLKQFKSGIKAQDVKCNTGFELVIKSTDGSPACVKPDTASKLVELGWAKEIVSTPVNIISNMKPVIQNYTGYQSKIIPGPLVLSSCGGGGYHSFSNILNSTGFHVFYNITNSGTAFDDNYVIEPGHAGTITYVINAGSSPTPYMTNSYFQKELDITNYAVFYHYVTDYEELLHNPSVTIHNGDYASCFKRPNGSCAGLSGPITGPIQASVVDHPGVIVSFDPASELLQYNDTSQGKSSQIITMTVSVDYNAPQGTYWIVLSPEECLGGKIFLLTIGNQQYHELNK